MLPEEKIRRFWIDLMVRELGYPRSLMVVEKELALLPHLLDSPQNFPKRRVDLLVYARRGECFWPLLMVEYKAMALEEAHARQLVGYNVFVKAPYIGLANGEHCLVARKDEGVFTEGLPRYEELFPT